MSHNDAYFAKGKEIGAQESATSCITKTYSFGSYLSGSTVLNVSISGYTVISAGILSSRIYQSTGDNDDHQNIIYNGQLNLSYDASGIISISSSGSWPHATPNYGGTIIVTYKKI